MIGREKRMAPYGAIIKTVDGDVDRGQNINGTRILRPLSRKLQE